MHGRWPTATVLAAAAAVLVPTGRISAQDGMYVGANLGLSGAGFLVNDWSPKSEFLEWSAQGFRAGTLGYRHGPWRAEVEYLTVQLTMDTGPLASPVDDGLEAVTGLPAVRSIVGTLSSETGVLKLSREFNLQPRLKPYLGLGIGAASVSADYAVAWGQSSEPLVDFLACLFTFLQVCGSSGGAVRFDTVDGRALDPTKPPALVFRDVIAAYHAFAGLEYHVTDRIAVSSELRRMHFARFEDEHRLRLADGDDNISARYGLITDDLGWVAFGFGTSYRF